MLDPGGENMGKEDTSRIEEERISAHVEDYLDRLRKRGFRMTNQRRIIIETLLRNIGKHPNARELLDLVQQEDDSIGIATVYRTIELLSRMGLLNLINMDEGFSRFEVPDEQMHFHLYCRSCGKVVHLTGEDKKMGTVRKWAQEAGFDILPQTFEIAGICPECLNKGVLEEPFPRGDRPGCGRFCRRKGRGWRKDE